MVLALPAPAKLNRFLAVLGRRADGFHELELVTTVLAGVAELTDTVAGESDSRLSLAIAGPRGEGLVADESNLVMKAWRLLEEVANRPLPANLRLHKRIPHGAGLGGGSSDAAAALRLGNELYHLGLPPGRLLALATRLGSDVPLFLLGGTSLGLGRGERVMPLRPIPLEPMLLVHPGLHVSTPSVYRALAQAGYSAPESLPALAEGIAPPWRNDLTPAALLVCPALAELQAALRATGGEPLLCGSGSCWVARYSHNQARDAARDRLEQEHPNWSCWTL